MTSIVLERENWLSFSHYFERFNITYCHLRHTTSLEYKQKQYKILYVVSNEI